jgi:hypothetical protein
MFSRKLANQKAAAALSLAKKKGKQAGNSSLGPQEILLYKTEK